MKHYFYAFGAILCWASLPAATGSGLDGLSTEELMFFSFISAAIYLYVQDVMINRSFKLYIPPLRGCIWGVWGIFLYHYMYYLALDRAPLAEGAILATTWSLWIVLFSSVLQLRRLAPTIVMTALLGFFGASLVIGAGSDLSFQSTHMVGFLLALCCGVIWSSFSVGLPYFRMTRDPMTFFCIVAAVLSTGLYIVSWPHGIPSVKGLLSAVYLGCVPLGLSFFLWNRAVTGGNMVIIGFLSYLTPPLAVLMVAVIHGQRVPYQVLLGMVVILAASMLGRTALGKLLKQKR